MLACRLAQRPWLAYGLILLLQLHVVWNYWHDADLNPGDTSFYQVAAASWAHVQKIDFGFSPLYEIFYGIILSIVHDVYAASMIHRVVIVTGVSLLMLAALRAILNPAFALLMTAWWTVVPTNFNALYEVHLFGLIPVLASVWVVARLKGPLGRGITCAILVDGALLVRNELILAAGLFLCICVAYELHARHRIGFSVASLVRGYVIPITLALLLAGGVYERSYVQGANLREEFHQKSVLALCTAYAANEGQRDPTVFSGNPFTQCQPLMRTTFGRTLPTLIQALEANPHALAAFVGWNLVETPGAIALGLFDASPYGDNPGYIPVHLDSRVALGLSILVCLTISAGAVMYRRNRRRWHSLWSESRIWAVVVLGVLTIQTLFTVDVTERPWTEYTFTLTIASLVVIGASAAALLSSSRLGRHANVAAPALVLALVVAIPAYYHALPRPVRDGVERLKPWRQALANTQVVLAGSVESAAICRFLAVSYDRYCMGDPWVNLVAPGTDPRNVGSILNHAHANAVYADAPLFSDPAFGFFLRHPGVQGWREVAGGTGANGPWALLVPVGQQLNPPS